MASNSPFTRIAWFVAIWIASVAALTAVAYAIRLAIL